MTTLTLVLVTLGIYRIAHMIAIEEGPFSAIAWLRGHIDPDQMTWVGRGIRCGLCISFWLALAAALILGATWIEWLGIAGGALVIHKMVNGR